jgi:hypothetical protein
VRADGTIFRRAPRAAVEQRRASAGPTDQKPLGHDRNCCSFVVWKPPRVERNGREEGGRRDADVGVGRRDTPFRGRDVGPALQQP